MKPRIVVVGSLNMDVVCEVERVPEAGETVHGDAVTFVPGGKGANQAVAAARLGADVTMIGCLGADAFGARLREGLVSEGIDDTHVLEHESLASGVALIFVDAEAQNRITVVSGANGALMPEHVDAAAEVLRGAALLLVQLETPMETVERAMRLAHEAGVPVMLNPAPAQDLPLHWSPLIDYLVPNEHEAALITGVDVHDDASAAAAATLLQSRGIPCPLITLGARGVLLKDDGPARRIAAPRVTAVDTTAAGDTFIGALAVALAEGESLDRSAGFAVRAASLSVTRRGAQPSIPHRDEI